MTHGRPTLTRRVVHGLTAAAAFAAVLVASSHAGDAAAAKRTCSKAKTAQWLRQAGELDFAPGLTAYVEGVDCADVTGDRRLDSLFYVGLHGSCDPLLSGVLRRTRSGDLVLVRKFSGCHLAMLPLQRGLELLKPTESGCCPDAFWVSRFRWRRGRLIKIKRTRVEQAPARFFP